MSCPGCGYNMRDTRDGLCPECAWVMEIGVLRANRDQRPALGVSCAWCLLIGALFLLLSFGIGPPARSNAEEWLLAGTAASMFAYGVLGIGALCWTRHRAFRGAHRWLAIGWVLYAVFIPALALRIISFG